MRLSLTIFLLATLLSARSPGQSEQPVRLWLEADNLDGFYPSSAAIQSPPQGVAVPPTGPSAVAPLGGDVFPPLTCKTPIAAPLSQVKAYVASDGRLQVLLPSSELLGMGGRPTGPSLHVLLDGHGPWKGLVQKLVPGMVPRVETRFTWPGVVMTQTCFASASGSRGFYVGVDLHNAGEQKAKFRLVGLINGQAGTATLRLVWGDKFQQTTTPAATEAGPKLAAGWEYEVELSPRETARSLLQLQSDSTPPAGEEKGSPYCAAYAVWQKRLAPAATIQVPDAKLQLAHNACLRQMLMLIEERPGGANGRAPMARALKGLEHYYGSNPYDTFQVSRALDAVGMKAEAEQLLRWQLTRLRPCGVFEMWEHQKPHPTNVDQWIVQGLAAEALWQHYLLWGDDAWLREIAPGLVRAAQATLKARQTQPVRTGSVDVNGLLPPGFGDGGLPNGCHWSQNAGPLAGLYIAMEAAKKLGLKEADELARGAADFQRSFDETRRRAVAAFDGKTLPAFPGAAGAEATRAYWGAVMSVSAFNAISPADPAAVAALRFLHRHKDPGGLHCNLGYSAGVWPYMSAEVAQWHARLGEFDEAWRILRAIVAHASPTVCWYEEHQRAPPRGHGDPADVWAAAEMVYLTRKLMVWESGDELHLCPGMPPEWAATDATIRAQNVPTPWGRCSYEIKFDDGEATAKIQFAGVRHPAKVHVALPPPKSAKWIEVKVAGAQTHEKNDRGVVIAGPGKEVEVRVRAF